MPLMAKATAAAGTSAHGMRLRQTDAGRLRVQPLLAILSAMCALCGGESAAAGVTPAPSQTIRYCPEAECSEYMIVEAENFTAMADESAPTSSSSSRPSASSPSWVPQAWAHDPNLFSSDVSNVFMNRRAYLHSDANATVGATAAASVTIPATGVYTLLARYEARHAPQ